MIESALQQKMLEQMAQLKQQNLMRQRRLQPKNIIDFSNNDYLGLSRSPLLTEALVKGCHQFGVGSGASPLVSGYSQAHNLLETALCQHTGHQAAMLFNCGFSANHALMTTLFSHNDKVIADKLVHASIIDGLRDSGVSFKRYVHNDVNSAKNAIIHFHPSALITESVFSMDGDLAPLKALRHLSAQHNIWLIVDDAHGFGCDYGKVTSELADIQLITFGKALGCQGAALLGSKTFIDYMVANCRHYIYSTSLSPALASTALAALNIIQQHPQRQQQLTNNIAVFKALCLSKICSQYNLSLVDSVTGIQPLIIGDNEQTLLIAQMMAEKGFLIGAIRPPTVPKGTARLRITLNSAHTEQQIVSLIDNLNITLAAITKHEIGKAE